MDPDQVVIINPTEVVYQLEHPSTRYLAYANALPCAMVCTWLFNKGIKYLCAVTSLVFFFVHAYFKSKQYVDYYDKMVVGLDVFLFHFLASVVFPCILVNLEVHLVRKLYYRVCMPVFVCKYVPLMLLFLLLPAFSETMDYWADMVLNNFLRPVYFEAPPHSKN